MGTGPKVLVVDDNAMN